MAYQAAALPTAWLLLVAPLLAAAGADDGRLDDLHAMQGVWELVEVMMYDAATETQFPIDDPSGTFTLRGDQVQIDVDLGGAAMKIDYQISLPVSHGHKRFEAIISEDRVIRGIFRIDGDTMIRCNSPAGDDYPADFDHGTYSVWKRAKRQ